MIRQRLRQRFGVHAAITRHFDHRVLQGLRSRDGRFAKSTSLRDTRFDRAIRDPEHTFGRNIEKDDVALAFCRFQPLKQKLQIQAFSGDVAGRLDFGIGWNRVVLALVLHKVAGQVDQADAFVLGKLFHQLADRLRHLAAAHFLLIDHVETGSG